MFNFFLQQRVRKSAPKEPPSSQSTPSPADVIMDSPIR